MTRQHIKDALRRQQQIEALVRSLNNAKACMTCGAPAVQEIELERGCAVFPDVKGKIHVCAQHSIKIDPL